jgi:hypothetical protein
LNLDQFFKVLSQEQSIINLANQQLARVGYQIVRANSNGATPPKAADKRAGTFKCPKCPRTFGYQMHVARHLNAQHAKKKTR